MRLWPRRTEAEERMRAFQRNLDPPLIYYPVSSVLLDANLALATPNVWACVRVLADAAASCPLLVYRRDDTGRHRVGGRTADLIERPSEGSTQANLIGTVIQHLNLWGNSYVGKFRGVDGRVEQLMAIPPNQVQVQIRNGRVVFTVTMVGSGEMSEHGLDDIVHIKALSTDGVVGLSPITMMRQALTLDDAVRTASTGLFLNGARPSGILSGPQLTAVQAQAMKDQWNAKHYGEMAGGIAVLSGDLQFTPLSMPADDAEFVAARKLSATEIARCFRVPPWMVAASDDSSMTYSNTESQAQSFVTFSLMPWLKAIEQAFSNDRDLFTANQYCEFLLDGLLRADSMTRAQIYEKALDPLTGWMTRDEVRRLENLEPETNVPTSAPSTNGAVIA